MVLSRRVTVIAMAVIIVLLSGAYRIDAHWFIHVMISSAAAVIAYLIYWLIVEGK